MAGGSGTRCGGALPKQFALLGGMPVLARTINAVAAALPGAEIVAVLPERHAEAPSGSIRCGADWRRSAPTRS